MPFNADLQFGGHVNLHPIESPTRPVQHLFNALLTATKAFFEEAHATSSRATPLDPLPEEQQRVFEAIMQDDIVGPLGRQGAYALLLVEAARYDNPNFVAHWEARSPTDRRTSFIARSHVIVVPQRNTNSHNYRLHEPYVCVPGRRNPSHNLMAQSAEGTTGNSLLWTCVRCPTREEIAGFVTAQIEGTRYDSRNIMEGLL